MKKALLILPVLALLLTTNAFADLIVNGSFEADPFTDQGNYELGLNGNDVTGWFIPSSDGTYPWGLQDGAFGASTPYGNQWIVLGLWSSGFEYSIQQTLSGLSVGGVYSLDFAISSEQFCCAQAQVAFLSGSSTASQVFVAPASGQWWTQWSEHTMNFVADASSVTIQFKQVNPSANGYDLGLDNVSVEGLTTVPEPTTLMLFGLGLAATGARRMRHSKVV